MVIDRVNLKSALNINLEIENAKSQVVTPKDIVPDKRSKFYFSSNLPDLPDPNTGPLG